MAEFSCPEFFELEPELKNDFYGSTQESIEIMDACIDRLAVDHSEADLNALFRAIHSVKGNCNMVFIAPVVEALHELEDIVTDVRDGDIVYHPSYGEFFQSVIHETDEILRDLIATGVGDQDLLDSLSCLTSAVHGAVGEERIEMAGLATEAIAKGHFDLEQARSDRARKTRSVAQRDAAAAVDSIVPSEEAIAQSPLVFFRELAECAHALDPWRVIRMERTLTLCAHLNQAFVADISNEELKAAVLVHEFAMGLVPESIRNKESDLSDDETALMRRHVDMGAGLLRQIPGFAAAADFLAAHHERFDATGYPQGLGGDDIPIGATILALADTFIAITSDRPNRPYKMTLMTAVREINLQQGQQFSAQQVAAFNSVIKKDYIGQARW